MWYTHLYKRHGFQVKRRLNCYRSKDKLKGAATNKKWMLCQPEELDKKQWNHAMSFWEYSPSWQDGKEAVCAVED